MPEVERDLVVGEVLVVTVEAGKFRLATKTLASPYTKTYPPPNQSSGGDASRVFVAYLDGREAGVLQVSAHWTGFAQVDDLAVNHFARHKGAATALLSAAKTWATAQRLIGLRVETQNTNVPACRLYQACGFRLAGVDFMLYVGAADVAHEVALFWYWQPHTAV
jgi:ribosomal protein S18 acetylase RimI-like enzyme